MNNTQKTTIASVVVVGAIAAIAVQFHSYHQDLYGRFPELDRKIVRKAYRRMMLVALSGQLTDEQTANDDTMDRVFLDEVQKLVNK